MTNQSLKAQTAGGMFRSAIRIKAFESGQSIAGIILAGILLPEDYRLFGLLALFVVYSTVLFIEIRMISGLIQHQNRMNAVFSSVCIYNLIQRSGFYC